MRYSPSELERLSMLFDAPMKQLEDEIMTDIVRRIKINGEITRSADWQIHRLYELGMSKQDIENSLQNLTGISPQEVQSLYSQVIQKGYAEDEKLYRLKGKPYIPFAENKPLQQFITATAMQTSQNMYNLTQSMGFAVRNTNGLTQFLPIAQYYQDTLDNAMLGITSGAFDYNTVLKKTVAQLTNSGLRTIDYASGHSNRVEVATRRAVMTGFNQIVAKVNEENAEKLGTEYFEVSYHGGARPTHQVWQGRVYSKKDLETVCGLGDVQGLCGANCYHSYSPFFPEIDVRTYTDEQLDEMNRQENTPVEYNGKKYTKYEALQRQRRLETTMRAERQKIKLLQEGGASEDDIITARAKYRVTSAEYTRFSKAMNLPQQRERVTVDGLGNIGVGKYKKTVVNLTESGISGKKYSANTNNTVNLEYISSEDYHKKFKGITGDYQVDEQIYKQSKAMLVHRSKTNKEDMCLIDSRTGNIVGRQTNSKSDFGVDYNNSLNNAIKNNPRDVLISIHNHPTNNPPTGSDIVANGSKGYKLGVVVTHNGRVFTYKAGKTPFTASSFGKQVDKYRSLNYNESDAIIQTLSDYTKQYGIEWSER